jgi:hypothetical protein
VISKSSEKGNFGSGAELSGFAGWSVRFANSLGARCLSWQSTTDIHWIFAERVLVFRGPAPEGTGN